MSVKIPGMVQGYHILAYSLLLLSMQSTAVTANATAQLIEKCRHAGLQFHGRTPDDGSFLFSCCGRSVIHVGSFH